MYCETIMDDILVFIKELSHGKIRKFIKGIVEEQFENIPQEM